MCIKPSMVIAGAWLHPVYSGQMIATLTSYYAERYYDATGQAISQAAYTKMSHQIYCEYGLHPDWTVGVEGMGLLESNPSSADNRELVHWDGTMNFFVRTPLFQQGGHIVSLQPLLKLPNINPHHTIYDTPHSERAAAELKLSYGYGFTTDLHHFIDVSTSYRIHHDTPIGLWKMEATLGVRTNEAWMSLGQIFVEKMVNTSDSHDALQAVTVQLSEVFTVNQEHSLQVGAYHTVSGKNVGVGSGVVLSYWYNF